MITETLITNMVIGVAIVVVSLMIVLIFQIYKTGEKQK
jgi:multisubunit Na+/H+ antiporter MnhC subunit